MHIRKSGLEKLTRQINKIIVFLRFVSQFVYYRIFSQFCTRVKKRLVLTLSNKETDFFFSLDKGLFAKQIRTQNLCFLSTFFRILPQVLLRKPCYDFSFLQVKEFHGNQIQYTDLSSLSNSPTNSPVHPIGWSDGRCVQKAGTYSTQIDNLRLLDIPRS